MKNKELNKSGDIFWLDGYEGKARGGLYTRCNLSKCISILNEKNARIVGIKIDKEDEHNLELIMDWEEERND